MPRRHAPSWLAVALAVLVPLATAGCGDDEPEDVPGDASSTTTSSTTAEPDEPGGSTTGAAYSVDAELLDRVVVAVNDFFGRLDEVERSSFDAMADHTCSELADGKAVGRSAADTAAAIAAGVPAGPDVAQYLPGMILTAQFYLSEGDCGVDEAYAREVRVALEPHQNAATAGSL